MRLTEEEIENGKLSGEHFTQAVMELKVRGFCAFENLMSKTWVQELRDAFLPILNDFAAKNPPKPLTRGTGSTILNLKAAF